MPKKKLTKTQVKRKMKVITNGMTNPPFKLDVAIPVVASNQVSLAGAMDTDIGTAQMAVTLVFA